METFYARKANKLLKINEDAVDRYLGQGYTITDLKGNVIKKGTPNDINQLNAEYKKQEVEIKSLKEENAKLLAEVKSLKEELVKVKSETPVSTEPKQTRKRKQTTSDEEATE